MYKFFAKIDAFTFKLVVDVLKDLITNAVICFNFAEKTMSIQSLDPDKVCYINYTIHTFEDIEIAELTNKDYFQIFIPHLYKIMRGIKKGQFLQISLHQDLDRKVHLSLCDEDGTVHWKTDFKTIDTGSASPYLPSLESTNFSTYGDISTSRLQTICSSLNMFSSVAKISVTPKTITLSADGPIGSTEHVIDPVQQDAYIQCVAKSEASGTFYTKFIEKFCKPALSKTVAFSMENNQPLHLSYVLEDSTLDMHLMPVTFNRVSL